MCNFPKGKSETMNQMQEAMHTLSLRNSSRIFFSGNEDMHKYLAKIMLTRLLFIMIKYLQNNDQ